VVNKEYRTHVISEILFKFKVFETDRQVATVAMETTQLVLSQFKNLTYKVRIE